jgi:hypothetical protein
MNESTGKSRTASAYDFAGPWRGFDCAVQWNITPYPDLTNQSVEERAARAFCSEITLFRSAVAVSSTELSRSDCVPLGLNNSRATVFDPRRSFSRPSTGMISKLFRTSLKTPAVGRVKAATEFSADRSSTRDPASPHAYPSATSYSPALGISTVHWAEPGPVHNAEVLGASSATDPCSRAARAYSRRMADLLSFENAGAAAAHPPATARVNCRRVINRLELSLHRKLQSAWRTPDI